jgi:probable phosphoglycerate mutase
MLIIVRHGQTAANASGLLLGRADPELNDVGRAQARALARALPAATVISSPLRRAVETARAISPDVSIDERWIELDYGTYDGEPISSVPSEVWSSWRSDPEFTPPGGESLRALRARVEDALEEWSARDDGRDVVVVTHVSPIKAAVGWALGVDDQVNWRTHVTPGSITRIGPGPVLRSFNEVVAGAG